MQAKNFISNRFQSIGLTWSVIIYCILFAILVNCGHEAGPLTSSESLEPEDDPIDETTTEVASEEKAEDCSQVQTCYLDSDQDGFGDSLESITLPTCPAEGIPVCGDELGYVADATDCDDANLDVNPDTSELCNDAIDNDCDGRTDEDCSTAQPSNTERAPLYMTTMTHMEGLFKDDRVESLFLNHVEALRYGMDLAEEYGAILTIESEKPFAIANTKWGIDIMAEIRDRGFGVGTHCDIGFNSPLMSVDEFAALFAANKTLVDDLVGAENNLGCSGGGSVNDWAQAASLAGFKYLDGIVSMHYLSMPLENRPGPEWTDDYIRNGHYHLNAPVDINERIYLFGVADATDFVADEEPVITISSGEMGLLSAVAEGGRESGNDIIMNDDGFMFDQNDTDVLVDIIRAVDETRDPAQIAKMCVYLPVTFFSNANGEALRYFFATMQELQNEGIITWATQRQVYEAYVDATE